MVSPVEKSGYDVTSVLKASYLDVAVRPDGDGIAYVTLNAIPPARGGTMQLLLGEPSATGWRSTQLAPSPGPNAVGTLIYNTWLGAASGLRGLVYWDATTAPFPSMWLVRPDGTRSKIATAVTTDFRNLDPTSPGFEGISRDGRHVVFVSPQHLVPIPGSPDTEGRELLYEWIDDGANGGAGTLRLVNVNDDGTLIDPGESARLGAIPGVPRGFGVSKGARHAISANGSRIYFQSPPPPTEGAAGGPLYLRAGGTETVEVSAPEAGGSPASNVRYLDASDDGAVAYFWADAALTGDAQPGGGVYRYRAAGGDRLTWVGGATVAPTAIGSKDGTRLYYSLPASAPDAGLYLVEGQQPAQPIAAFSADVRGGLSDSFCTTADISSDGRYLVLRTDGEGIWRYDAAADQLDQVAVGAVKTALRRGGCIRSTTTPRFFGQVMSDEGQVFFEAADPLVPEDSNHQFDVYSWDEGGVELISTGTAPTASYMLGTSESGASVFFATRERLVRVDGDGLQDIYVARTGGGFAEDAGAVPCSGDSCQGEGVDPPEAPVPGSASFDGSGNLARKAGDGEATSERCVKLDRRHDQAKKMQRKLRRKSRKLERRAERASGKRARKLTARAKRQVKRSARQGRKARRAKRRAKKLGCDASKTARRAGCEHLGNEEKGRQNSLRRAWRRERRGYRGRRRRPDGKIEHRGHDAGRLERKARECERGSK